MTFVDFFDWKYVNTVTVLCDIFLWYLLRQNMAMNSIMFWEMWVPMIIFALYDATETMHGRIALFKLPDFFTENNRKWFHHGFCALLIILALYYQSSVARSFTGMWDAAILFHLCCFLTAFWLSNSIRQFFERPWLGFCLIMIARSAFALMWTSALYKMRIVFM